MYYLDNRQHNIPHIHVRYQDEEAIISIPRPLICSNTRYKYGLMGNSYTYLEGLLMVNNDKRWEQRFSNYKKALSQLKEAVDLIRMRPLSNLEKQGMIQVFEYTHELAWKTLKDFLKSRGNIQIYGSRDVTREAFQLGLLEDGELWMKMIQSRNLTSHVYDESVAEEMIKLICDLYYEAFNKLLIKMNDLQTRGV